MGKCNTTVPAAQDGQQEQYHLGQRRLGGIRSTMPLNDQDPDHDAIATLCRRHLAALGDLFTQVTQVTQHLRLCRSE